MSTSQAPSEITAAPRAAFVLKDVYTTGEVAQVCKISQQTVIRCFDSGRLRGFRVPGSKFRRVPRESLMAFMRENGIPTDGMTIGKRRVLLVDDDPAIIEMLSDILGADGRFELRAAGNGYDAGIQTMDFRPDIILLDFMLPDINGSVVCRRIRSNPELSQTRIIIVSGAVRPAEIDELMKSGADEFIQKPFDVQNLLERMWALLQV